MNKETPEWHGKFGSLFCSKCNKEVPFLEAETDIPWLALCPEHWKELTDLIKKYIDD